MCKPAGIEWECWNKNIGNKWSIIDQDAKSKDTFQKESNHKSRKLLIHNSFGMLNCSTQCWMWSLQKNNMFTVTSPTYIIISELLEHSQMPNVCRSSVHFHSAARKTWSADEQQQPMILPEWTTSDLLAVMDINKEAAILSHVSIAMRGTVHGADYECIILNI